MPPISSPVLKTESADLQADQKFHGDGGNRTHATFPPSVRLKAWALALRDLTDQGALDGRLTVAPGVVVLYNPEKGARFLIDGQPPITLTDADLDHTGLDVVHRDPDIPTGLRDALAAGLIETESA